MAIVEMSLALKLDCIKSTKLFITSNLEIKFPSAKKDNTGKTKAIPRVSKKTEITMKINKIKTLFTYFLVRIFDAFLSNCIKLR